MHLLLGDPQDTLCLSICHALNALNYPVRMITNPFVHPLRFAWQLNNNQSATQLIWGDEPPIHERDIAGVLVRNAGWVDPGGWQPEDLAYVQSETQAALLAWLWSLPCSVVNRYPPSSWYRPHPPFLSWRPVLRRCGLPTMEALVTNVEAEARGFGQELALKGLPGAVYGPLTGELHYLVMDDKEWRGLAALQRVAPVSLAPPHEETQMVCVVGEQVVWESAPSSHTVLLEPALRRFASEIGLSFVALALAQSSEGIAVVAVETHPSLELFGTAAQEQIVQEMVHLLIGQNGARHSAEPAMHRSFL
jgi:hypothetical protein